jgi:hypothetical protein
VVGKLVELKRQAWFNGYKSVKYVHLHDAVTTHFPLWLVLFWEAVIDLHRSAIKLWAAAKEWLSVEICQKRSSERRQVAEDARAFLAALPWDSEPVRTMWQFLGCHFTTGSQQDSLLDRLSDCIADQPDVVGQLCVKSLALSPKILEAAAAQQTGTYKTAQTFQNIRELGEKIAGRNQCVLTLHHLGKNNLHFVAIVIDSEHKTIHYGNSFSTAIPSDLLEAYQWWLVQHTSSPFTVSTLPIMFQEPEDTSLCGFLAMNSLQHFAFPAAFPLILQPGIQVARMKAFFLLGQQMLDKVCLGAGVKLAWY